VTSFASEPIRTLEPFQPADLATLQAIRRAAFAPVFLSFREIVGPDIAAIAFARADEEQAKHLDDLAASSEKCHLQVARVDGVVVGFVSFTIAEGSEVGEIGLNAIDPTCAGKGLGTRMYEEVLAQMKNAGARVATVGTGGDPSHAPARRAYEKVGFGPAVPSVYLYRML
jgi:ribosomal protein S18 acetylase RimI-like enzyme